MNNNLDTLQFNFNINNIDNNEIFNNNDIINILKFEEDNDYLSNIYYTNNNDILFSIDISDIDYYLKLSHNNDKWLLDYIEYKTEKILTDKDLEQFLDIIDKINDVINNPKFNLLITLTNIIELICEFINENNDNESESNTDESESNTDESENNSDDDLYSKISKNKFKPDYSNFINDNDYDDNEKDIYDNDNNDKDLFDDNDDNDDEKNNKYNEENLYEDYMSDNNFKDNSFKIDEEEDELIIEEFDIINNNYDKEAMNYFSEFNIEEKEEKNKINWELLRANSINYYKNIKNDINLDTEYQIKIIIYELNNIIKNKKNIEIIFNNNTLYDVNLILFDIKIKNNLSFEKLILNIKFNNLYPYYPLELNIILPLFDNKLNDSIISHEYFKLINWNPSNYILNLINDIENIILKYGELSNDEYINNDNMMILNNIIIKIYDKLSINNNKIKLSNDDIKYIKLVNNNDNKNKTVWNNGVGYGSGIKNNDWNIKQYLLDKDKKSNTIYNLLLELVDNLKKNVSNDLILYLNNNQKLNKLLDYYLGISFDINILSDNKLFDIIIELFLIIINNKYMIKDNIIIKNISNNKKLIDNYYKYSKDDNKLLYEFFDYININENNDNKNEDNILKKYQYMILSNNVSQFCNIDKLKLFSNKNYSPNFNQKHLMKELIVLEKSLPCDNESGIYICYSMNDISKIKFLIIPSNSSPYAYGCYIFNMIICNNYPNNPPIVKLITNGYESVRFNPNLYNNGKVCLSLLGTWGGSSNESWIPSQSTILQVLISIQSLIFIDEPYYNEPGYETISRAEESRKYNEKIQINNIKYAMIDHIKNPDKDFKDLIYNHFKLNKDKIINKINKWLDETKESTIIYEKNNIKNNLLETFNKYNI